MEIARNDSPQAVTPNGYSRPVRADELELWIESPLLPADPGFAEWVAGERAFVSGKPPENLLVYESGGRYPGKLAFVHQEAGRLVFLAPAIAETGSVAAIAESLFDCAISIARDRGVTQLIGIIDSHNKNREIVSSSLLKVGFEPHQHKVLYQRSLDPNEPLPCRKKLIFKRADHLDGETLETAMRLHDEKWQHVSDFRTAFSEPGREWRVAFEDGVVVGLSLLKVDETMATMEYIATAPGLRGRGFGEAILACALNRSMSLGATTYLDSTETSNTPMIRLFEKFGCSKLVSRTEFVFKVE